jgi:hypothetical protein
MDLRNQLTLAALMGAIQHKDGETFRPETLLNTDNTTIQLEEAQEKALLAEGSAAKLKGLRKSASITKEAKKKRSLGVLVTTGATGRLVSTIAVIKDRRLKETSIHKARPNP